MDWNTYFLEPSIYRAFQWFSNLLEHIIYIHIFAHILMKLPQGQLQETLKILTFEFVSSVEKMVTLHEEQLSCSSNHTH